MLFEDFLAELRSPSGRLRAVDLVRLSRMTPEQREAFGAVWPTLARDRRRQVMRRLVELAEDNVELNFDCIFLIGLEDEDAQVRVEAVRGLWEYNSPDLIAPLLRLLRQDSDARVRAEAALALGRFVLMYEYGNLRQRYFREVEVVLQQVLADQTEVDEVRARALEAIGAHDSPWVRQAIREAYESGVHRLKVGAIHAMGRSCEGRWLPLLLRELSSDDPELRYEAALACGALEDERAVPHLARMLSDPDGEVKEAAIAALGEIGGEEAKALLLGLSRDPSPSVREAALAALAQIDFGEDPLSFRYRV